MSFATASPITTHYRKEWNTVKAGLLTYPDADTQGAKYPHLLPTWDPEEKYPPLQPFKHVDRGFFGDPGYERLWAEADSKVDHFDITPRFGTEIRSGVQLSKLSPEAKDDLALLVERRGIVIFRDQDFADQPVEFIQNWGKHFGPLHIHPSSGAPKGVPEVHSLFIRPRPDDLKFVHKRRINSNLFHTDTSFEIQPPGVTLFTVVQGPKSGGDTVFVDTVGAYESLSKKYKKSLEGLYAVHSQQGQAQDSVAHGGILRRDSVENIHPLVRYHPVLKRKLLFAGNGFVTRILGLKDKESQNILNFITNIVETSVNLQVHVKWEPGTVALWDNRRTLHSPTVDWDTPELRHAFRITPQAERPVASEEEYENWTVEKELEEQKNKQAILSAFPDEVEDFGL